MECQHEETRWVGDTPVADPKTLKFKGRFDTKQCADCGEILEKVPLGSKVN